MAGEEKEHLCTQRREKKYPQGLPIRYRNNDTENGQEKVVVVVWFSVGGEEGGLREKQLII